MLDDHTMTEFAKACCVCQDSVLKFLANGLLNRKLFKAIDVTAASSHKVANFQERAKQIVSKAYGSDEDFFVVDTPSDTAYKPYDPDAEKPATQIFIETPRGQQELSRISENVQNLGKRYTLTRYYFPESVRDGIQSVADTLLFKE